LAVINLVALIPNNTSGRVISNQLLRSATSIGANLIEGGASSSRLEFKKFQEIALKSGNETVYWLNLLVDSLLVSENKVTALLDEAEQICRMIASGVIKLKSK
jgi:four helix bundle protein